MQCKLIIWGKDLYQIWIAFQLFVDHSSRSFTHLWIKRNESYTPINQASARGRVFLSSDGECHWVCDIKRKSRHESIAVFCIVSVSFLPLHLLDFCWFSVLIVKGTARTQSPTTKNCTPESTTFVSIAGVSRAEVQWQGLVLREPPLRSRLPLSQVSMIVQRFYLQFLSWPSSPLSEN